MWGRVNKWKWHSKWTFHLITFVAFAADARQSDVTSADQSGDASGIQLEHVGMWRRGKQPGGLPIACEMRHECGLDPDTQAQDLGWTRHTILSFELEVGCRSFPLQSQLALGGSTF